MDWLGESPVFQGYSPALAIGQGEGVIGLSELAQVLLWPEDRAELMSELRSGSEAAFDCLLTHYRAPVYSLVSRMLRDPNDAAEVTQEVFLKAFCGIGSFRQSSSLKTWLYRISVREALNHRRWFWRHHRQQISIDANLTDNSTPMEFESPDSSPFDEVAGREVRQRVQEALGGLPELFRTAVILRDLEGLSYGEVAEVLDVSVGTVKSRILRGRRMLRNRLEPVFRTNRRPCEGI